MSGNSLEQLGDGGGDVGQLDDVALGGLGQLRRQFNGDRKLRDQAASHGNIPLLNLLTMHIYCQVKTLNMYLYLNNLPQFPWDWQTS